MNRCCAAMLVCLAPAVGLAGGMQFFEGSFDEALARADEEGKHVFVDVYTTWCGPCKIMDAVVFPRDDVGEYYNARFVNVKLDAEDESVKGPVISEQYEASAYPTYLYLNSDGTVVGRAIGALPPSLFVQVAGQLIEGRDSGFAELKARYERGDRDSEFVQDYLWAAQVDLALFDGDVMESYQRKEEINRAADEYFSSCDYSQLVNPRDFTLIAHYKDKKPRGDPLVEFVIEQYDAFLDVAPEITLARFVLEINYYAAQTLAEQGDERYLAYLDDLNGSLKRAVGYIGSLGSDSDSHLLHASLAAQTRGEYLSAAGRWDELLEYVQERLSEAGANRAGTLLTGSRYFQRAEDQEYKDLAFQYAREAHQLDPANLSGALSYASLLSVRGDTQEAEKVLQGALSALEGKEGAARSREILRSQLERIPQ